ncbi:MAG TPA: aldo/keto reductase, partial [Planctomycetota bacterium]|nr:aldo/keto reductase [Planctomycetota bacterium]
MKYGNVPGIDKPVSRLVQGCVMLKPDNWESGANLLDDVFALGCRTFDTAHCYGSGGSERTLGRWITERGVRDKVVVITKGAHPYGGRNRVTPLDITADVVESLERLGTDFIDLYLLHRDDPAMDVGPIIDVLNQHKKAGRIGAFGGSNWTHQRIAEANAYAKANGREGFTVSSPNFSLAEQVQPPWADCLTISGPANVDARAYYRKAKMPLFCWSSLAGGFFSGKITRENTDALGEYFGKLCRDCYFTDDNFERLARVTQLAAEKGKTIPQIALAWVMSQPLD